MPVPIDNCPHENIEEDDGKEVCVDCGFIFAEPGGGWKDPEVGNE